MNVSVRIGTVVSVVLILLLSAAGARAQTAALLRFEVRGATDAQHQLERDARDGLSQKLALVPAERVETIVAAEKTLSACEEPGCTRRFAQRAEARFIVRGNVSYDGSTYTIDLRADDAASGRALSAETVKCELCGWAELREKVAAAGRALGARAAKEPAAAVEKQPIASPAVVPVRGPVIHQGKWVAAAIAVGLLGTGAVMLGENDHCTIDVPAMAGCPRFYDTRIEGPLFLAAGAAFAATSITFFVLDRKPRVVPSLSPTTGGATLSLTVHY